MRAYTKQYEKYKRIRHFKYFPETLSFGTPEEVTVNWMGRFGIICDEGA